MPGIPQTLLSSIRQTLMECDEFFNPRLLYAVFSSEELGPWQAGLPIANNLSEQVDITISYLAEKRRTNGDRALAILLRTLGERYQPGDDRHDRLVKLAEQVAM